MRVKKPFAILKSVSGDLEKDCEMVRIEYREVDDASQESRKEVAKSLVKRLTDEDLPCAGSPSDVYYVVDLGVLTRLSAKELWLLHMVGEAAKG